MTLQKHCLIRCITASDLLACVPLSVSLWRHIWVSILQVPKRGNGSVCLVYFQKYAHETAHCLTHSSLTSRFFIHPTPTEHTPIRQPEQHLTTRVHFQCCCGTDVTSGHGKWKRFTFCPPAQSICRFNALDTQLIGGKIVTIHQ